METFKNGVGKLEALQQVTQLGLMEHPQSWPQDILCHLTSLLLMLATVLLVLLSGTCACPCCCCTCTCTPALCSCFLGSALWPGRSGMPSLPETGRLGSPPGGDGLPGPLGLHPRGLKGPGFASSSHLSRWPLLSSAFPGPSLAAQ